MSRRHDAAPGRIDWDEVHAQLDRAEAAARDALHPSPERARRVLDERARVLARVPARVPDASEVLEVAAFSLDDERYAVETRYVRRVARLGPAALTPIPGAPDVLAGVINSGGEILAVFDLLALVGSPGAGSAERTRVVVLGTEREELAILADRVHEVTTLRLADVLDPPAAPEAGRRRLLRGVTASAWVVLDGAALLEDPRLVVNQADDTGD